MLPVLKLTNLGQWPNFILTKITLLLMSRHTPVNLLLCTGVYYYTGGYHNTSVYHYRCVHHYTGMYNYTGMYDYIVRQISHILLD